MFWPQCPSSISRWIGGRGSDLLLAGGDELHSGAGSDELNGALGDDVLFGGADDDKLIGGRGSDVLVGEDGNDEMKGGAGDDVLVGGDGDDELSGGRGDDAFVYQSNQGESLGFDVIRDFRSGQDTLMVSDDLTLLFDDEVGFTRVRVTDANESLVGTIDILGNSFDSLSDVSQVNNQKIDDLFA